MMTAFTLERVTVGDQTLHGLSTGVGKRRMAIHVHGTWGNFYENSIATYFADFYSSLGYGFATVNVPGHDGESITEDFDQSIGALKAWVDHFDNAEGIIWQGHSLGALKIIRLLADSPNLGGLPQVDGVVLLSPFDLAAFYAQSSSPDVIVQQARKASAAVEAGKESDFVPRTEFDIWPIAYGAWHRALARGGTLDVFPTAADNVGPIADWPWPTLVAIGGSDFAASPSPEAVIGLLGKLAPNVVSHLIANAPHNFAGHESELMRHLQSFSSTLQA